MATTTARATIRAEERYAWHGQSLLIVNVRGECDGTTLPLAGYYFREARYLSRLELRVNGNAPWLCEDAVVSAEELQFAYAYPEVSNYGGGGTGQSQDDTPVDEDGVPQRAVDIRLAYHVGIASVEAVAVVTNRAAKTPVSLRFE
jgi:hypothetical protein